MNFFKLQRKFVNLYVFWNLLILNHNFPYNPKKIKKIQKKKLKKIIKAAYKLPFYKRRFDACGITPKDIKTPEDLVKLPTMNKEDYKALIEEEAKYKPYIKEHFFKSNSSGSSGVPFTSYRSPRAEAVDRANWIRFSMKNGHNPFFGKTMKFGNPSHIITSESLINKLGILRLKILSYTEDVAVLIKKFNEYKPDFMYTTKSNFLMMIFYARKHNIPMHKPACYCSIGELVEPQERKIMEETLGNGYFNSYGSSETGACTFITDGAEYHNISHDTHVINVYNSKNELCDKGRFIITNFWNYELPLINYDIGDEGEIFTGADGLKYIKRINGRCNDWLVFDDGSYINYQQFNVATQTRNDILQFRFIQEDYNNITIQLVKAQWATAENETIEQELEAEFKKLILKNNINYHFQWLEEIPPDENGKKRMIISKIPKNEIENILSSRKEEK